MKKQLLIASLVCGSMLLHACGGSSTPVATHFSVTAAGTATVGTALTITVSAVDSSGAVVASYSGTVQLTSSDAKAVLAGGALTNGMGTFHVTMGTAGSQTVTATSGTLTGTSNSITVSPGAPTQFSVTPSTASVAAGTAFNITVNALDASNNVVTTYAGTVHFTSSDAQATLPGNMALTNGTGTFSVTLKTAGSQSITAMDTAAASSGTSSPITVNPGPATGITAQAPAAAETTGIAFMVTVNATDAYGNVATSYTGTVHLTSTDGQATLPANSGLSGGTGSFSVTLKTLGAQTITATDTVTASLKGTSGAINVVSNAATHLSVTGPGSAETRQTFQFTVSALDAANNTSVGYPGTVHTTSTDSQAKLPTDSTLTAGTGNFSATLESVGSGTQSITATDKTTSSITGSASMSVAAPAALVITSAAPPAGTVGGRYNPHTIRVCTYHILNYCVRWAFEQVYGFPIAGSGGIGPYSWSWAPGTGSSLPAGLSVTNQGSLACPPVSTLQYFTYRPACIHGIPTQPGTYNVVLTITDSGLPAVQATANYTIVISPPPPPVVNTTPAPPPGVVNQPYSSYTFTASGYPPLTWSESGALPAGLAFDNSTGTLSGTPTQTGSFAITVTATDQFKQSSTAAGFTIVVSAHGFVATGSMTTSRTLHTATLLTGGKVLIAGGQVDANTLLATAELFDSGTGSFTATGNMQTSRSQHSATLLNDGRVLLAGGGSGTQGSAVASAELYDATGATSTATGSMQTARYGHTAILLGNGKVLVIGGANATGTALASAELFDSSTGTFTATGSMHTARRAHTATLLANGMVLVAGGIDATSTNLDTAELYNPTAGTFTAVVGMLTVTRANHTATLLTTGTDAGKVILAGGVDATGVARITAELYDPTAKSFTATTNMVSAHAYHTATLLNGTVLLTGGVDSSGNATAVVEVFDPTSGSFTATGSLVTAREQHTATLLANGTEVLATGGINSSGALASAELYQ